MTIYRLNRVPDKLHVSLLELLGIRLDGPSAAQTSLRFRLAEVGRRAAADPGRPTEVGTPRTATEESIIFQVDEDFEIPAALPAAYVLQRGGQVKSIGARRRRRQAVRRRPARVRQPAGRRRRGLPRLRGAARAAADRGRRRRLAGARRRREPRGPAAALGGLPGRRRVARGRGARGPHRRLQLRLGHRAARAPAALGDPAAGRPPDALAALPDRRQDPPRRRRDDLHAAAGDLLDHRPAPVGARLPATHASQITSEIVGVSDGTPGQVFPLRNAPVLKPHGRRDARGPGPGVRRLGPLGAARRLRRLDRVRPPLQPRRRLGRGRVRPRDPRDRRRLDPVRLRAAEGRGAALHPLPPRRRAHWAT